MIVEIIDIGSGNIRSIQNWIESMHVQTRIVTNPLDLKSKFVILPGVGSAGPYMEKLKKSSFDVAIKEHVNNENRLLGICLGFQLMGTHSEEDGGIEGLGLIEGYTQRLDMEETHNGWEKYILNIDMMNNQSFGSQLKLTRKKNINGRVYFNHEYGFINKDTDNFNLAISNEFKQYSSMIVKNNIIGIQFHPEKSQQTGLDLLSVIL